MLALRDSGVRFVAVDMPEANDLTVGIMALVAQAEREAISRRTKEALAVAKARGVKLGNPNGAESLRRGGNGVQLCAPPLSPMPRVSPATLPPSLRISGPEARPPSGSGSSPPNSPQGASGHGAAGTGRCRM